MRNRREVIFSYISPLLAACGGRDRAFAAKPTPTPRIAYQEPSLLEKLFNQQLVQVEERRRQIELEFTGSQLVDLPSELLNEYIRLNALLFSERYTRQPDSRKLPYINLVNATKVLQWEEYLSSHKKEKEAGDDIVANETVRVNRTQRIVYINKNSRAFTREVALQTQALTRIDPSGNPLTIFRSFLHVGYFEVSKYLPFN